MVLYFLKKTVLHEGKKEVYRFVALRQYLRQVTFMKVGGEGGRKKGIKCMEGDSQLKKEVYDGRKDGKKGRMEGRQDSVKEER